VPKTHQQQFTARHLYYPCNYVHNNYRQLNIAHDASIISNWQGTNLLSICLHGGWKKTKTSDNNCNKSWPIWITRYSASSNAARTG